MTRPATNFSTLIAQAAMFPPLKTAVVCPEDRNSLGGVILYAFCDVERAVQRRLRAANVIEVFRMREADATRKRELDILARLQAKYGANRESPSSSPRTSPPQADLFAT